MVMVNLMPWRQHRIARRWQAVQRLGVGMMITFMAGMVSVYWQHCLNQQQMKTLDAWSAAQKEAAALYARTLTAHQQLEQQQLEQRQRLLIRQQFTHWTDAVRSLETVLPQDIWLKGLKKNQQDLALQGVSRGVTALHQLQEALGLRPGIQQATLGALHRDSAGNVSFNLILRLNETGESYE